MPVQRIWSTYDGVASYAEPKLIVSELTTSLAVKTHVDLILKELVYASEK